MKICFIFFFVILLVIPISGGNFNETNEVFYESFDDSAYIDQYWELRNEITGCVGTTTKDGYLSYSILNQNCSPDQWGADTTGIHTQLQKQKVHRIEVKFDYDFPLMGEFGFSGWNPETTSSWSVSLSDSWSATSGRVKYVQVVNGEVVENENTGSGTIPVSSIGMTLRVTFDYAETTTAKLEFLGGFEKSHTYFDVPDFTHFSVTFSIKVDYFSPDTIMKIDSYTEYYNNASVSEFIDDRTLESSEIQSSFSNIPLQTVIIIGILSVLGSVFFYQRSQNLKSKKFYPAVINKSNVNLHNKSSIQNKEAIRAANRTISCSSCNTVNPPLSSFCTECGFYLK